jgi:phosphotransferase system  glucose/maltose/N-acetylglucosamine-specific IIC component
MDPKIALDERMAVYTPIILTITEVIMRLAPRTFDKTRFAPLVSFVVGIVTVIVVDVLWGPFGRMSVLKGLLMGVFSSGLYDAGKSVKAIVGR